MRDAKTIRQIILGIIVGDFIPVIKTGDEYLKVSYEIMDFLKTLTNEEIQEIRNSKP